jgi:hypothetical protein
MYGTARYRQLDVKSVINSEHDQYFSPGHGSPVTLLV